MKCLLLDWMRGAAVIGAALLALAGTPALAEECVGQNLIAQLPQDERDAIRQAVAQVPYHDGLFWRARRGAAQITLIGTYHFDDRRHAPTLARFAPEIAQADRLLVEMGPQEQDRLQAELARDPTLIVQPHGPTLPERLTEAQWQELSAAMRERGMPAVMVSRMRPWYVATLLGISPCMMRQIAKQGAESGLNFRLIAAAEKAGVPVQALEPWDTAFQMFSDLSPQEELDMILYGLPAARHADDYATTLTDAYFAGDVWSIWEFGRIDGYRNSDLPPDQIDRLTDEAREMLMDRRNASWIAPLTKAAEQAAGRGKPVVAAFGALHLPGEGGVLRLLEREGWQIERLPMR